MFGQASDYYNMDGHKLSRRIESILFLAPGNQSHFLRLQNPYTTSSIPETPSTMKMFRWKSRSSSSNSSTRSVASSESARSGSEAELDDLELARLEMDAGPAKSTKKRLSMFKPMSAKNAVSPLLEE